METQTTDNKKAIAVNKVGVLTNTKSSEASRNRHDMINARNVVQVITGMSRTEIKETQLDLLCKWLEMYLRATPELAADYADSKELQNKWLAEWLRREVDFTEVFTAWHASERMYVKRIACTDQLSEQQLDLIKYRAFCFWEDYHLTATFNTGSYSYRLIAEKFKEVYHGRL